MSGDWIAAGGLLLDILGVGVLAIPDIPTAARRFRFGRLRAARNYLDRGGLADGDIGFKEAVNLHNESQPNVDIAPSDVTKIEYGPYLRPVFKDGQVVDREVINRISIEYVEGAEFAGLEIAEFGTPPENFYPKIRQIVERGERQTRLLGLLLIIIGFILQLPNA